jgi:hypothetical protein
LANVAERESIKRAFPTLVVDMGAFFDQFDRATAWLIPNPEYDGVLSAEDASAVPQGVAGLKLEVHPGVDNSGGTLAKVVSCRCTAYAWIEPPRAMIRRPLFKI